MSNKLKLLIFFSFCAFCSLAQKTAIEKTPLPSWITPLEESVKSSVNHYQLSNGLYFMQNHEVVHDVKDAVSYYTVTKIVNQAGVDAIGNIQLELDTSYQRLELHRCQIRRMGRSLDLLPETEFSMISEESSTSSNVFSGTVTASTILKDIQVGDELEFSYTIFGSNPLFANHEHSTLYLNGVSHLDYMVVRHITDASKKYAYRCDSISDTKLVDRVVDGLRYLEVERFNVPPVDIEEGMSSASYAFDLLQITSDSTWADVRTWGLNLYETEVSVEVDSFTTYFKNTYGDSFNGLTKALDYLQNTIRYTSVNGGVGSYRPSEPAEVFRRGYGDCKDKSQVLVQVLKSFGHEASYPAFVNSTYGNLLPKIQPGISWFDHVIVMSVMGEDTMWLDPTLAFQGGHILDRHSYNYGYALVLDAAQEQPLLAMPTKTEFYFTAIQEDYDIGHLKSDGSLTVRNTFKGKTADYLRNMLNYYSMKDLEESFKNAYSVVFPQIYSASRLEIEDDYDKNVVKIIEKYIIPNPWVVESHSGVDIQVVNYEPMSVYEYLSPISCTPRRFPVDLTKNVEFELDVRIRLPDNSIYRMDNFSADNSFYSFTKEQVITSTTETNIKYRYKSKADIVMPDDFNSYCSAINADCRRLFLKIMMFESK